MRAGGPDTPRQSFLMAALAAAAGSIPLPVNLNTWGLISLVVACLVQEPVADLRKRLMQGFLWLVPALYFLWLCCSYFWDVTGGFEMKDIERYAMLLFVPVAVASLPRLSLKLLRITAAIFITVTAGICCCCLLKSWFDYQVYHDPRLFYYHYLSRQMGLNAVFLSNYCLASILWLLYDAFALRQRTSALRSVISGVVCIFLFGMIMLLSSKLITSLTVLLVAAMLLYVGYLRRRFVAAAIIVLLFAGSGLFAVSRLGYFNWRIAETSFKVYSGPEDNNNGLSIRILMWKVAWDLFRERPVLGYGVRGSRTTVVERYRDAHFDLGYREGYHSHNQYLQSALAGGIPALALLLLMIAWMARDGLRKKNLLLLLLLFHFVVQNFVESTFEVQQELSFYVLFLFLLYYHAPVPLARRQVNDKHE